MTNKLVVIINSLKVPKIKKISLYETKFLVPKYSCLQNPWLGVYRHQIPVLSVLDWICWTPPNKIPGYATGADKFLARPRGKQANVSVRMAWISFGALPCKKNNLITARVSMLSKSRESLPCFRGCFLPGRAKDLSAPRYVRCSTQK